jgi:hypothetical protein
MWRKEDDEEELFSDIQNKVYSCHSSFINRAFVGYLRKQDFSSRDICSSSSFPHSLSFFLRWESQQKILLKKFV